MRHGLAARRLISTLLTLMLPVAVANQEPMPEQPSTEVVLPDQTETQPESQSKPAVPPAESRGQMLYENHCQECHTSVVHIRERHRVRSMDDLEHWVKRWAGTLKLPWNVDDIHDVVDYLNQRYYKLQ